MDMPDFLTDRLVVEIKKNVSAVRNVRDEILQLAKHLADNPDRSAYLLLDNPRISEERLREEFSQLVRVLQPHIAEQITLMTTSDENFERFVNDLSSADRTRLEHELDLLSDTATCLRRPDMQSEVIKTLLLRWIQGRRPATASELVEEVGTSFRTVKAAIRRLGPAMAPSTNKRYGFDRFPAEVWSRLMARSPHMRSTELYVDRSNQPRSPDSLMKRILNWNRPDIAVGGVVGASWHFPDLDIIGSPRLDICVHAPRNEVEPVRVDRLDPGLERAEDIHAPARLAIHYLRRQEAHFKESDEGYLVADPVECLLDLQEAGLGYQSAQFEEYLESIGDGRSW